MKSLITAIASMMILMMFMMQFVANEKTYIRAYITDSIIDSFQEDWDEADEITPESEKNLREELLSTTKGGVILEDIEAVEKGSYKLNLRIMDVIGPIKLIPGVNENAAEYKRIVFVKQDKEIQDASSSDIEVESNSDINIEAGIRLNEEGRVK